MSRRVAAFLAALVATAAAAAAATGTSLPTNAAVDLRADVSTIVYSAARSEPPLAVIRSAEDNNLSAFGRLERVGNRSASIDAVVGTLLRDEITRQSQPLGRVAELAIQARGMTVGPVPGRAPPAARNAALHARTS